MIHKYWCKGCGARIEAGDGGSCAAEECRAAARSAAGAGVTKEQVFEAINALRAKHPHMVDRFNISQLEAAGRLLRWDAGDEVLRVAADVVAWRPKLVDPFEVAAPTPGPDAVMEAFRADVQRMAEVRLNKVLPSKVALPAPVLERGATGAVAVMPPEHFDCAGCGARGFHKYWGIKAAEVGRRPHDANYVCICGPCALALKQHAGYPHFMITDEQIAKMDGYYLLKSDYAFYKARLAMPGHGEVQAAMGARSQGERPKPF